VTYTIKKKKRGEGRGEEGKGGRTMATKINKNM